MGGNASSTARGGSSYIGDLGGLDDLRRVTDERLLGPGPGHAASSHVVNNAKSVTIHPDVTEFRYPGEFSFVAQCLEAARKVLRKNLALKKDFFVLFSL